jgi:hypothetical protein
MKKITSLLLVLIVNVISFAQDGTKKIDVDINTNSGSNWYSSPIVWIIGAAVFILLLVALLRGGGRKAD